MRTRHDESRHRGRPRRLRKVLAFGALATETGNLGGPIAAHFTINFLNLRFITAAPP